MIRRLRIVGWRAFDDVTLDLEDGLTFVIAENGVGKTSLIQAAAWGLYGGLSRVDARTARRVGAESTRVELEVELPDGRVLSIDREVRARSEPMRARLDGVELDDRGVDLALTAAFGASQEFLSLTTILPSDAVNHDAGGAFQLQAHLRRVFGVDDLQQAAQTLERLHDEAEAAARAVRSASRRAVEDLSRLRTQLTGAQTVETAAVAARAAARQVVEFAEAQLREARDQQARRDQAARSASEFATLLAQARRAAGRGVRLGRIARPSQLVERLEAVEVAAVEALDELRREAATVAGRLAAGRAASDALHSAGPECPVCRRDLSGEDIARAEATHQQELAALAAREVALAGEVETAGKRLQELRGVSRRAARLPDLDDVVEPVDLAAAEFAAQAARADVEALDEELAVARARRATLVTQVAEEERRVDELELATQAHRREAVTSVAAAVMRATADAIVAERIDPLAAEIRHRWKRVFGERGSLELRPDGHLVLVRGIHEIPFGQFSSGEQVVALLATRLLVLGASTRASFLWLDEPLEHLDPRNRRITASLMSAAGANVRQILVTTYEEPLARRLAAAASAHLRYVRT